MSRTEQLTIKGRNEYARTVAMYEELAKSADEVVAEGSAAMADVVRGWMADDAKCAARGFRCGA